MNAYPRPENLPYPARVLSMRGASRGEPEVGQSESWPEGQPDGRCGARGHASQAWTREALGFRPGPLRGSATSVAGRGQACGAKSPRVATSPEERTRVLRRRGGTLKGVAVCLCLRQSEDKPRLLPRCAFRRSASPHLEGRF